MRPCSRCGRDTLVAFYFGTAGPLCEPCFSRACGFGRKSGLLERLAAALMWWRRR